MHRSQQSLSSYQTHVTVNQLSYDSAHLHIIRSGCPHNGLLMQTRRIPIATSKYQQSVAKAQFQYSDCVVLSGMCQFFMTTFGFERKARRRFGQIGLR